MFNFRKYINPVGARRRRYKKICELVGLKPEHKILDIGAGLGESFEDFNKENEIIAMDIRPDHKIFQDNVRNITGDATEMGFFKDKEFDLVLCVGVLEHIFPYEKLQKIAREIARVGKSYLVIVPHMYTIFEPHHQMPFWQLYSHKFRQFLVRHMDVAWVKKNPEGKYEELNYFKADEWLSLFPDAKLVSYNHIFLGIIKNYIIYKKGE